MAGERLTQEQKVETFYDSTFKDMVPSNADYTAFIKAVTSMNPIEMGRIFGEYKKNVDKGADFKTFSQSMFGVHSARQKRLYTREEVVEAMYSVGVSQEWGKEGQEQWIEYFASVMPIIGEDQYLKDAVDRFLGAYSNATEDENLCRERFQELAQDLGSDLGEAINRMKIYFRNKMIGNDVKNHPMESFEDVVISKYLDPNEVNNQVVVAQLREVFEKAREHDTAEMVAAGSEGSGDPPTRDLINDEAELRKILDPPTEKVPDPDEYESGSGDDVDIIEMNTSDEYGDDDFMAEVLGTPDGIDDMPSVYGSERDDASGEFEVETGAFHQEELVPRTISNTERIILKNVRKYGLEKGIPMLIKGLDSKDASLRSVSLDALREISGKRYDPLSYLWNAWWKDVQDDYLSDGGEKVCRYIDSLLEEASSDPVIHDSVTIPLPPRPAPGEATKFQEDLKGIPQYEAPAPEALAPEEGPAAEEPMDNRAKMREVIERMSNLRKKEGEANGQ